ncbi:hypothetical protein CKA32_003045 [Geitlerinema sp. FC II]|nr:hypothetical protein CKA32_003045 [Geitlerinema sp. FC II]
MRCQNAIEIRETRRSIGSGCRPSQLDDLIQTIEKEIKYKYINNTKTETTFL